MILINEGEAANNITANTIVTGQNEFIMNASQTHHWLNYVPNLEGHYIVSSKVESGSSGGSAYLPTKQVNDGANNNTSASQFESTGTPKYWANYTDTAILVAPTPSAALNIEMTYSRRIAELSSSNTTNWLTENAQDLLLYACLMEASTFTKSREDYVIYSDRYKQAVESINNQARRRRRDDFTAPANVMGENYLKEMGT